MDCNTLFYPTHFARRWAAAVMIPRTAAVGQNLSAALFPPLTTNTAVEAKNHVIEYITDSPIAFATAENIPEINDTKPPYLYVYLSILIPIMPDYLVQHGPTCPSTSIGIFFKNICAASFIILVLASLKSGESSLCVLVTISSYT